MLFVVFTLLIAYRHRLYIARKPWIGIRDHYYKVLEEERRQFSWLHFTGITKIVFYDNVLTNLECFASSYQNYITLTSKQLDTDLTMLKVAVIVAFFARWGRSGSSIWMCRHPFMYRWCTSLHITRIKSNMICDWFVG